MSQVNLKYIIIDFMLPAVKDYIYTVTYICMYANYFYEVEKKNPAL